MTDIYAQLSYTQYKQLEAQLRLWEQIETSHTSVDGYYHKALRLTLGDITLEIQGPAVKQPIPEVAKTFAEPPMDDLDDRLLHDHYHRTQNGMNTGFPQLPDRPDQL